MRTHGPVRPLPPRGIFYRRLARSGLLAGAIVAGSLIVGTLGYRFLGHLHWIDALLNAAMILTGMGPVDRLDATEGKLFAAAYALYSGVAFLSTAALLLAPVAHHVLHRFHIDMQAEEKD